MGKIDYPKPQGENVLIRHGRQHMTVRSISTNSEIHLSVYLDTSSVLSLLQKNCADLSSAKEKRMNVTMRDVLVHQARQPLFAITLTR